MELVLTVNDSVARKIRGLSVLSGMSADDITQDLSNIIESIITEKIIRTVQPEGEDQDTSLVLGTPINRNNHTVLKINSGKTLPHFLGNGQKAEDEPIEFDEDNNIYEMDDGPDSCEKDVDVDDDNEEVASVGHSLSYLDEEDLDQALPPDLIQELKETRMAVKNKHGKDVTYDDELMTDVQSLAEDDEFEGQGQIMIDAAMSMKGPAAKKSVHLGSDVPLNEDGSQGLDILPVDFGIDEISGNDRGAMGFFNLSVNGKRGDLSRRNTVKKKIIKKA